MEQLKIAVILGSTRPGRNGEAVAAWVVQQAAGRPDASYQLLDLVDFPLPHLDEELPPSMGDYRNEHTRAWADKVTGYDGFESYGSLGGARAIEHLRAISSELQIAHVRTQLSFFLFDDFRDFAVFAPGPRHSEAASTMFGQLESWAAAMRTVRA